LRRFLSLVCVGGLVLGAAAAGAESWSVVEGRISIHGKKLPLSGAFEGSEFEPEPPDGDTPTVLNLDDFAFTAGRRELTPPTPIEYDGLVPVHYLQIADAILLEGEQVVFLRVRSGGKLVDESDDEVTFRFLELRGDAEDGGYAIGRLPDTGLPRRLVLKGDVYEVEQSFGLPAEACSETPPTGGGNAGSGGAIISYQRFDTGAQEQVQFVRPGGAAVLNRIHAGSSQISGQLVSGGSVYLVNPAGVVFASTSAAPPTLDELGIQAAADAEVQIEAPDVLRITSSGDLVIDGPRLGAASATWTSVTVATSGNIAIHGGLDAPASLRIEAGGELRIDGPGEIVPDEGSVVVPPPPVLVPQYCTGLRPIWPADDRRVGRFSLVASAARQVKIDVRPEQKRNRVDPGSDRAIGVAILGSRSLDVRDIEFDSLRLGRGEAPALVPFSPIAGHPGAPIPVDLESLIRRVNRDRYPDLLTAFRIRDAEVAFGDSELCWVAETTSGELLEGCDAITTAPFAAPPR
jgi:filamentous hemagglutinin family protein